MIAKEPEEGFEIQKFKEIESFISKDFFKEILACNDSKINDMFKNLFLSCLDYIGQQSEQPVSQKGALHSKKATQIIRFAQYLSD